MSSASARARTRPRISRLQALACLVVTPAITSVVLAFAHDPRDSNSAHSLYSRQADYVGADTCRGCHPDHFDSWQRTFHSTMTQLPNAESVLGRFDGTAIHLYGHSATPLRRGDKFYIDLPAIAGETPRSAEVALTVGSRRYQQYFERVESPTGVVYKRLPILWHVVEERWLHLNGVFLEADNDDWSVHLGVWNANCVFCHNTGIAPGFRERIGADGRTRARGFQSGVADLGISCEACHGPGVEHVNRNTSPLERYKAQLGFEVADDIVDPKSLPQEESAALCGQCHSQRLPTPHERIWEYLDKGPSFRPGDPLEQHVTPVTRETLSLDPRQPDAFKNRFWAEGTARLTAYEYLGLTQSPCFKAGELTCISCHTMHEGDVKGQLPPNMKSDAACTQCHGEVAHNIKAHTHHEPASSGSRCLSCHMPKVVYGVLDIHRSHRIESPDVRRDTEAGRPNACTQCHHDKSALWAADKMQGFWGDAYQRPQGRTQEVSLELPEALALLHAGDPLERAVTVHHLGRTDTGRTHEQLSFALAHVLVALGDGYGAIRSLALRSAHNLERALAMKIPALDGYDPQGASEARQRALTAAFAEFEGAVQGSLGPPPVRGLLDRQYRLDRTSVSALLSLQQTKAISIGE